MERIKLVLNGVSDIVGIEGLSILVLADTDGKRQITVVCESDVSKQIEMRIAKVPITKFLLPEVLCTLLQKQYGADMEIMISDVVGGQYIANLYCCGMDKPMSIRISDAVLMSLAGGIPLYIDARLMLMQSTVCDSNTSRISVPINALSNDMLKEALEKAISEEDYELASQLNKELKSRNKADDTL